MLDDNINVACYCYNFVTPIFVLITFNLYAGFKSPSMAVRAKPKLDTFGTKSCSNKMLLDLKSLWMTGRQAHYSVLTES